MSRVAHAPRRSLLMSFNVESEPPGSLGPLSDLLREREKTRPGRADCHHHQGITAEEKERALFVTWERICARQGDASLDALDRADRVFAAIWMLEAELNNGGFSQWMFNSYGDYAEFTVAALREVGTEQAAIVCERFFAMLPGGKPLRDQAARRAQLEATEAGLGQHAFEDECQQLETEFYALEDQLRDLLFAFIQGSRDDRR